MRVPKPSLLEAAIYTVLTPELTPYNTSITPRYPRSINQLDGREAIISMNALSDSIEGRVITPGLLSPLIAFTIFSNEYVYTKKIQEVLIDILDGLDRHDFVMTGQEVQNFYKERRTPVIVDTNTELAVGGVDYRFTISTVGLH